MAKQIVFSPLRHEGTIFYFKYSLPNFIIGGKPTERPPVIPHYRLAEPNLLSSSYKILS